MKNIGLIIGTNRPNRIGKHIGDWISKQFNSKTLNLQVIDLETENLPFLDEPNIPAEHNYMQEHTKQWSEKISKLDGIIILYPQYNWGYPAVLKNALDYLHTEWAGMPVSTIVYGSHGGFQAQIALNLVLRGLRMNVLSTNLGLTIDTKNFDISELEEYSADVSTIQSEFERLLN
ncbi:NADPH-dependent FMN reductase [Companilactobacillus ginsenosidimutans]|uniref:NADPH-dependent FMN reductase n=1 Tax=Companilactobacillus ginsenosidimutans TaxID=1007676 RepID=A0A0H4QF40_9LACO|nr:NAD(P)H-dependent oxidoreductase [Companilactobacillus ginsenosidimutans]AKP66994.1 NADPH-dependent FMN reductase [Companilactobacillus ginsenosidimutans]